MLDDGAGVRNEVGFLLIRQRYADRFFPGTSVLQTRLRYALFVPWLLPHLRAHARHLGHVIALVERLKVR